MKNGRKKILDLVHDLEEGAKELDATAAELIEQSITNTEIALKLRILLEDLTDEQCDQLVLEWPTSDLN